LRRLHYYGAASHAIRSEAMCRHHLLRSNETLRYRPDNLTC